MALTREELGGCAPLTAEHIRETELPFRCWLDQKGAPNPIWVDLVKVFEAGWTWGAEFYSCGGGVPKTHICAGSQYGKTWRLWCKYTLRWEEEPWTN